MFALLNQTLQASHVGVGHKMQQPKTSDQKPFKTTVSIPSSHHDPAVKYDVDTSTTLDPLMSRTLSFLPTKFKHYLWIVLLYFATFLKKWIISIPMRILFGMILISQFIGTVIMIDQCFLLFFHGPPYPENMHPHRKYATPILIYIDTPSVPTGRPLN